MTAQHSQLVSRGAGCSRGHLSSGGKFTLGSLATAYGHNEASQPASKRVPSSRVVNCPVKKGRAKPRSAVVWSGRKPHTTNGPRSSTLARSNSTLSKLRGTPPSWEELDRTQFDKQPQCGRIACLPDHSTGGTSSATPSIKAFGSHIPSVRQSQRHLTRRALGSHCKDWSTIGAIGATFFPSQCLWPPMPWVLPSNR
jgi:hypothetical protein